MLGLVAALSALALPALAQPAPTEPATTEPRPAQSGTDLDAANLGATDAQDPPEVRDPSGTLRIVYTGGLGGIGSGSSRFSILGALRGAALRTGQAFVEPQIDHGTLAKRGHILRVDGKIAPLLDFLNAGGVECGAPTPAWALADVTDVVLFDTAPTENHAKMLEALSSPHIDMERRTCTSAGGGEATLWSPAGQPLPKDFSPRTWEFRRALTNDDLTIVSRPVDEASRRVHRTAALMKARSGSPTLYVDAGSFVDGASSVQGGALSLHRALGFDTLQRLAPSVLVPGDTELVAGANQFFQDIAGRDLPYIATNWRVEGDATGLELPPYRIVEAETAGGTVRVGFVGILSPSLIASAPQLAVDGVAITDPITSVQPIIDDLYELDPPVDLIVALTTAPGPELSELRRKLRGVDILIGDPTFATLRVERREADLRQLPSDAKGAPLTAPMDGLATLDILLKGQPLRPTTLGIEAVHLFDDAPRDPTVGGAVMDTRLQVYPPLDRPLLGPPVASQTWSEADWNTLVCEAVRQQTDADVVLLRELPPPPRFPGTASALSVVDSLALLDTLEVHQLPGTNMQRLADRAGSIPVVCGVTPGARLWKVGQRWLDIDRSYRVVTTGVTVKGTPAGDILAGLRSTRVLDKPGVKPVLRPDGTPMTLHDAAMGRLNTLAADGKVVDSADIIMKETPALMQPLWLLRLRQISLSTETFQGTDNDSYASVPETLVTSPSSFTFGTVGDLALEYTSARLWTDMRFRTAFTQLSIDAEDPEETADDWVLSTSWALPGAAIPMDTKFQVMPFTELAYDSDYTPVELEDGTLSTHQADLSLTLGMSALRTGPIRALRAGGFANRDMARLSDKPMEYGGKLDWETYQSIGSAVVWTTYGSVQLWANTPDDDESDLRLRGFAETRFSLPLARWLNISTYGQGLLVKGRVPTTDEYGGTWLVGASFDAVGAFRL